MSERIHVSLLMIPEADASSLSGMYTVLNLYKNVVPDTVEFVAEVVAPDGLYRAAAGNPPCASNSLGLPVILERSLSQTERTDVVIIPSLFTDANGEWHTGNHPEIVDWIRGLYAAQTLICSSCTGALLLAETGLLDGREATQHWAFEHTFRRNFPQVKLNAAKVLVTAGDDDRIVMSGASAAWHDLVLYLIGRHVGPAAARAVAKFFLLQWHSEGQAPYITFHENTRHDDAVILAAQHWLRENSHKATPVESAIRQSGLTERSFNRRFRNATGLTPISYAQNLRIDEAKRYLETTPTPVDEISAMIGYEDPSFFRRVFKRLTGMTPRDYRRKFRVIGIKD